MQLPLVLDVCCGPRGFWFDRHDARALFVDKRRETHTVDVGTPGTKGRNALRIEPDIIARFDALPFADGAFALVVFDPPHVQRNAALGTMTKRHGFLTGDWRQMLRHGFSECFRVLRPEGVLVFKWAESDCPVSEILALTPEKPLFGQVSLRKPATHWVVFMKGSQKPPGPLPTFSVHLHCTACGGRGVFNGGPCHCQPSKPQPSESGGVER